MPDTLSLSLTGHPRRYSIDHHCGDVFREDDDYDGLALTIEVLSEAEAHMILHAIRTALPHWQTESEVTGG